MSKTSNTKNTKNKEVQEMTQATSKSEMFRKMYDEGLNVSEISKQTGAHYSYVYGVIQRMCNKRGEEVRKDKKYSKSDQIRQMVDEGYKVGQIAKELNSNYSFVYSVVKKYKESKENK